MKFLKRLSFVSIALFLSASQLLAAEDPANGMLRVGGSTTLLPIISQTAINFMKVYRNWNDVDPTFPDQKVTIFVSGGGSSFGVRSVLNKTVHIGLASRNLKESEKKLLGAHDVHLVGNDAIVFAANRNNPLHQVKINFTFTEVRSIFSGRHDSYRSISSNLAERRIVLLVRDSGAGSAEMLQKLIMGNSPISTHALQLPSQGAMLKKLESNRLAIGYISSGLVFGSDKIKPFALRGVVPTNLNVVNGSYAFVRPLHMVTKGTVGPMAQSFIDYVLGEGQSVVEASYYVPANRSEFSNAVD